MKLKGLRITRRADLTYDVTPIYWGKGGAEIRVPAKGGRGADLVALVKSVVLGLVDDLAHKE